jgi:hypothetical protein
VSPVSGKDYILVGWLAGLNRSGYYRETVSGAVGLGKMKRRR